jgi:predicted nucleic acid-binding protein
MNVVLDASAAAALAFRDERTDGLLGVLRKVETEGAFVAPNFRQEIVQVLLKGVRLERLSEEDAESFLELVDGWNLQAVADDSLSGLFRFCRTVGVTSYDGGALQLAVRRGLPLATVDGPLAKAAKTLRVKVLPAKG